MDNTGVFDQIQFSERIRRSFFEVLNTFEIFPYSNVNQPPSNSVIPVYIRKEDRFTKEKFSDCVDITLLNICNCLLYDSKKGCYSLETIKNKESDLYKFYEKHSSLYTITDEIRNEWSRVIQDLDDFTSIIPGEDEYKLNQIRYVKKSRNEVDTGIINMINVLIKIFCIDHQKFWNDFKNMDTIPTKLDELFRSISANPDTFSLEIEKQHLEIFQKDDRLKIVGSFNILFALKNAEIDLKLNHSPGHAYIEVIRYEKRISAEFGIEEVKRDNLMGILYTNFVKPESSMDGEDLIKSVYFSGQLQDNNRHKKEVLIKIFDWIAKQQKEIVLIEEFKDLVNVILNTVNLRDGGTFNFFKSCLIYCDNLTDSEIEEGWAKSISGENINMCRLWRKRVLDIQNRTISIDFSCPSKAFSELCSVLNQKESIQFSNQNLVLINYLLSTLKYSSIIKEIDIEMPFTIGIDDSQSIYTSILSFPNLNSLHLRFFSFVNDDLFDQMNNTLKQLNDKLECFGVSIHGLTEIKIESLISTLSGMQNLEKFCMYFTRSLKIEVKHIIEQTSRIKQLKKLQLMFHDYFHDIFYELLETISKLTNLNELEIYDLGIREVDMKQLRAVLWNTGELEKLVIANCTLGSSPVSEVFADFNILKKLQSVNIILKDTLISKNRLFNLFKSEYFDLLKKQNNLKHLDISYNRLPLDKLGYFFEYLANLENLRILNISSLILESYNLEEVSSKLAKLTKLENLDVSQLRIHRYLANQPDPNVFNCLLEAIDGMNNLTTLDISQKFPSPIKSLKLVSSLQKLTNLTFLNIRGWYITDEEKNEIRKKLPSLKKFIY